VHRDGAGRRAAVPPRARQGLVDGRILDASVLDRLAQDARSRAGTRTVARSRSSGLIGRSLRAVVDTTLFGERTVWVDCDVIQADGGTRTCAITGAWVALHDLFTRMNEKRLLRAWPLKSQVAAVSSACFERPRSST
jgi:ribonuclease PH